jgi:subtilisin family serine protease
VIKFRNLAPRLYALLVSSTFLVGACSGGAGGGGGGGGGGPTPTPTPVGISGCSGSATSIAEEKADILGPVLRPVRRNAGARVLTTQRISVKFAGSGQEPAVLAALGRIGGHQSASRNPQGWSVIDLPAGQNATAAAAALRGTPGIVDAAPVQARYLQDVIPNDAGFGLASQVNSGPQTTAVQQDMYKINMPAAWVITEGSSAVTIAVIDTGYDANNADVCAKVVGSAVFDLGTGNQDVGAGVTAQDNDGHGTNVSGIAAASTNNTTRWAGVGWNISLLEIRIFPHDTSGDPNPTASSADSAAAISYAVAHGAKVISMSYGSASSDPNELAAAAAAIAAGVIMVGASGNDGLNIIDFPAAYTGVISVGASAIDDYSDAGHMTTPTEYVAAYSNYGTGLSVVAPGGDPTFAQQSCTTGTCDYLQWVVNNYSTTAFAGAGFHSALFAGTSQATPHVAGLAALMVSKTPSTTPAMAKTLIQTWAHSIGDPHQGSGRIDAAATLTHT